MGVAHPQKCCGLCILNLQLFFGKCYASSGNSLRGNCFVAPIPRDHGNRYRSRSDNHSRAQGPRSIRTIQTQKEYRETEAAPSKSYPQPKSLNLSAEVA